MTAPASYCCWGGAVAIGSSRSLNFVRLPLPLSFSHLPRLLGLPESRESYTLKLRGADAKDYQCQVPDARWSRVLDGLAKPNSVGVYGYP
jgi:hypothetical protein